MAAGCSAMFFPFVRRWVSDGKVEKQNVRKIFANPLSQFFIVVSYFHYNTKGPETILYRLKVSLGSAFNDIFNLRNEPRRGEGGREQRKTPPPPPPIE